MYITYDEKTLITTGCSSSKPVNEPYIEVDKVDDDFYRAFDCHVVNLEDNSIKLDENIRQRKIKLRNSYLTREQQLAQENTQLQIELLRLKTFLNIPVSKTNSEQYWNDRLAKKYASEEQIKELRDMGIIK